jgi:hypothetical protein
VDAAHATSIVVLAMLDRRRRRVALISALIAGAFAALGVGTKPPRVYVGAHGEI